jgi:hypothetical protein
MKILRVGEALTYAERQTGVKVTELFASMRICLKVYISTTLHFIIFMILEANSNYFFMPH